MWVEGEARFLRFNQTYDVHEDNYAGQHLERFAAVCRRLKIEDFRYHDLRHTAASWMRMSGADIHTVAQLLGHKDLRMAARYQHLSPEFLSEAVGRLDAIFGESQPAPVAAKATEMASSSRSIVTRALPDVFAGKTDTRQDTDSVGSVIGDRTRTLRLERAAC
jgi:hypothetical protein